MHVVRYLVYDLDDDDNNNNNRSNVNVTSYNL